MGSNMFSLANVKGRPFRPATHDGVAISVSLLKINCTAVLWCLVVVRRAYVVAAGSSFSWKSVPEYKVQWNIRYLVGL